MEHGGWSDNWNVVDGAVESRCRTVHCSAVQCSSMQSKAVAYYGWVSVMLWQHDGTVWGGCALIWCCFRCYGIAWHTMGGSTQWYSMVECALHGMV